MKLSDENHMNLSCRRLLSLIAGAALACAAANAAVVVSIA
jgi:LSD1 subclass zinc finger protein